MDESDFVRKPDEVKKDRLIDDDYVMPSELWQNNTEEELNAILQMSKKIFEEQAEKEEQKEIEKIYNQIKEEKIKERKNKFDSIKMQLNKIILFDKENMKYYETLLSIIEMYEEQLIDDYRATIDEYNKLFSVLKTIRLPVIEIDNLKKIIICEE